MKLTFGELAVSAHRILPGLVVAAGLEGLATNLGAAREKAAGPEADSVVRIASASVAQTFSQRVVTKLP